MEVWASKPGLMLPTSSESQVPRVFLNPVFDFYEEGTSSLCVDLFLKVRCVM